MNPRPLGSRRNLELKYRRVPRDLTFQGEPMLIVVDWRNLAKNVSHSLRSGSVACIFPTEPEEISHRIMKRLFCIRAEHPDATIVLANDRQPYWREKFMLDWYGERGLEPVTYKGNRAGMAWLFQTPPGEMEQLYSMLLAQGAASIGATVVQDQGLEADDIFGVLASCATGEVIGWSGDSDWAQLVSDRVRVYNFCTGEFREPLDIRIKWIGGDSGDNVPGVPKRLKSGAPGRGNWGTQGAMKLLAQGNWAENLDLDHLERNRILTTLPCPLWNLDQAEQGLIESAQKYDRTDEFWDRYGVTPAVRKLLGDRAQREIWIDKLRLHLLRNAGPQTVKFALEEEASNE